MMCVLCDSFITEDITRHYVEVDQGSSTVLFGSI